MPRKRGIGEDMKRGVMKITLSIPRKGLGIDLVVDCAGLPERAVLKLAEDLEK
ncbi:MAG: hypothetical protein LBU15_00390 [Rickettsiales bacterium]|jgi:hypothetical protein|nr:hypothetical protein [Rickettsiales bacterium]